MATQERSIWDSFIKIANRVGVGAREKDGTSMTIMFIITFKFNKLL